MSSTADREIIIARVLHVPRWRLFQAWTDPQQVVQWWGPQGFTNTIQEMDVRPGGVWRFVMHGPDGADYGNQIAYQEVVALERLTYTHGSDPAGDACPFHVTVTFDDDSGGTLLTMRLRTETAEECAELRSFAVAGGNSSLDCLTEYLAHSGEQVDSALTLTLPSDREMLLTRVFNAPRERVFEAYTKPEHMRHWWGPRNSTMTVCDMDFRTGGAYRFVLRNPDGAEYGFRGEYREIVPPKRIVQTFEFEGMPGYVSLETLTLTEQSGKTTAQGLDRHDTPEARDGHLNSGMEAGAAETYDRLAEYLQELV